MAPEPAHGLASEHVTLRVLRVRRRVKGVVGHGIDEDLRDESGTLAVAGHEGHRCGEIAARAVAAHRDSTWIDTELACVATTHCKAAYESSTATGYFDSGAS